MISDGAFLHFYSHMIVPYMNLPGMAIYDFKLKDNVVKQVSWRKEKNTLSWTRIVSTL